MECDYIYGYVCVRSSLALNVLFFPSPRRLIAKCHTKQMNTKTDFFSLHTLSLISISSCADIYIYIHDRLKIPVHAFNHLDGKGKKCQADGSVRRDDDLTFFHSVFILPMMTLYLELFVMRLIIWQVTFQISH